MRNNVAVCVHIYYEDMWDYIVGYLKNIPENADFFITCRPQIHALVAERVARDLPGAQVVVLPNLGMDVLPFLQLCREKELHRYGAVLKLHTKNRATSLRAEQGRIMLDGLCGSPALVRQILDVFEHDPDAGMVGAAFQLRSANTLMYGNRSRMEALLATLGIRATDWPFFSGTMFWIAGRLLKDLADLAPDFQREIEQEAASTTGGDGMLAHTLERVFGALAASVGASVYLTEKKKPDGHDFLLLPWQQHGAASNWRPMGLYSPDLVRRYVHATAWRRLIANSGFFDVKYYRKVSAPYAVPGMDDLYHFVLYGDLLQLDPSDRFNVTYYQLRRPDVARKGICSLVHYIESGRREGGVAVPAEEDWRALGLRYFLFDPEWYRRTYGDVERLGMEPAEHYWRVGRYLSRAASSKFHAKGIPVLEDGAAAGQGDFVYFLKKYFLDEGLLYSQLKRAGENGDYALVADVARRILSKFGASRPLNEAMAVNDTLKGNWALAEKRWREFWAEVERGENSGRHGRSVMQFDRTPRKAEGFATVGPENLPSVTAGEAHQSTAKVCIYTTLFGDIDQLSSVSDPVPGVDYICFTDRPREATGWKQVITDPQQATNNLNAKVFKILPHKYLAEYEYSMFVDANTVFVGRVAELIEICRAGGDFVMWSHPTRDDAYVETCAIIGHVRHGPDGLLDQLRHYADEGLPRHTSMFEASFIWRRHTQPAVQELMEAWWQEICRFTSRDQLSLSYLVWKTGMRPCLLSSRLGTSRDNIYFLKVPHRKKHVEARAEVVTQEAAEGKERPGVELSAPALRAAARDVVFLYDEKYAQAGSTVLRSQQLSEIVAAHYEGQRNVRLVNSAADIHDAVVILAKGFLKLVTPEQLRSLRRDNIVVADFVDEPPRKELLGELDALMASSLCGYRSYRTLFRDMPAFHVTHHVDVRIPFQEEAAAGDFRAGYFGELVNTIRKEEIARLVDFNSVDTSKQTNDWIEALAGYNFHYALRRTRKIDGAKPFLKGFVAAHCGCNMMIQRSVGDAPFYLGADYPYLLDDDAGPETIVEALERAKDSIGGPEWRYGRQIMREVQARSSLPYVLNEFDNMLKAL